MFKFLLLTIALQGTTIAVMGQNSSCDNKVIKHTGWKQSAETQWTITLKSSGKGELMYLGAFHEDDPTHKQFKEITTEWNKFKPTVAFYEGPNRGIAETDSATITKFGESGYVRYLASKEGIKTVGLEPAPADLYKYLIANFPQEQVDVYSLCKEAMRLRTRKDYTKEQIVEETNRLITVAPKIFGISTSIKSIAELETAFKKYWGNKMEWWQAPQNWFDPGKSSAVTGGIFTNEINTLSSDYRDVHMYRILAEYVNKGERVFAVVGRNHVPLQIPALQCAIK